MEKQISPRYAPESDSWAADDSLVESVRKSGYPLQLSVASQLRETFTVVEEWGYTDRFTAEHRALDVFAFRRLSHKENFSTWIHLHVECKRSRMPHVFFRKVTPHSYDWIQVGGIPSNTLTVFFGDQRTSVPVAVALGLHGLPLFSDVPVAATIGRAELSGGGTGQVRKLSGDQPYRKLVLPLVSALEFDVGERISSNNPGFFPALVLSICVMDAPLVLAEGPQEPVTLSPTRWARVQREEPAAKRYEPRRIYAVDFVRADAFPEYLDVMLEPVLDEFSKRAPGIEQALRKGSAKLPRKNEDDNLVDALREHWSLLTAT